MFLSFDCFLFLFSCFRVFVFLVCFFVQCVPPVFLKPQKIAVLLDSWHKSQKWIMAKTRLVSQRCFQKSTDWLCPTCQVPRWLTYPIWSLKGPQHVKWKLFQFILFRGKPFGFGCFRMGFWGAPHKKKHNNPQQNPLDPWPLSEKVQKSLLRRYDWIHRECCPQKTNNCEASPGQESHAEKCPCRSKASVPCLGCQGDAEMPKWGNVMKHVGKLEKYEKWETSSWKCWKLKMLEMQSWT